MLVLRCTRQLLVRLKQLGDEPTLGSTTRLGDWYDNILRMGPAARTDLHQRTVPTSNRVARTNSRSLLGTLNDFSFMAGVHFTTAPHDTLEDIARDLVETPILPLGGARPIDLTTGLFRDA